MSKVRFRISSVIASLLFTGFGGAMSAMMNGGPNGMDNRLSSRRSHRPAVDLINIVPAVDNSKSETENLIDSEILQGNIDSESKYKKLWLAESLVSFLRIKCCNKSADDIKEMLEGNKDFFTLYATFGKEKVNVFDSARFLFDKIEVGKKSASDIDLKFYPFYPGDVSYKVCGHCEVESDQKFWNFKISEVKG